LVQVYDCPEEGFVSLKPGELPLHVNPAAELRLGPRSRVVIQAIGEVTDVEGNPKDVPIGPLLTADRLGCVTMKALFDQRGLPPKPDLGLKYGRTRYEIEKSGRSRDENIQSPGDVLGSKRG
jgi:hypothetical protein